MSCDPIFRSSTTSYPGSEPSCTPLRERSTNRPAAHHLRFHLDDLLDALVNAVTAALCLEHAPIVIPHLPDVDSQGFPMEMVYFVP